MEPMVEVRTGTECARDQSSFYNFDRASYYPLFQNAVFIFKRRSLILVEKR